MKLVAVLAMLIAAALLAACASVRVPSCEEMLRAAATAEQVAELLEARGIEPASAAKVADYVRQGRIAVAAACAIGI